jgi:hypothetical protein
MKKLMNLEGVKALSKMEQKNINGGYDGWCSDNCNCSSGTVCKEKYCDTELTWMCVAEEE